MPPVEPLLRLTAFAALMLALGAAEMTWPRRSLQLSRWARWPGNVGLLALGTVTLRLLLPAAAVGAAALAEREGWGLFNAVSLPGWLEVGVTILVLDLIIYAQHVLFHLMPILWRLHRVHHADIELDVTTGLRFHPVEILLSMSLKMVAVIALGASPLAVLIFELLLNAAAMWSHANLRLPEKMDGMLRRLLVTPDMHQTHHSIVPRETHSNFGFALSWWDRLFGTYHASPEAGHERLVIGLADFRAPSELKLDRMLLQPLRRGGGDGENGA